MKNVVLIGLSVLMLASLAHAETVTLTMFSYQDLTNSVGMANWEELLAAFTAEYPNIELDIEYGFDEAYHNKLQAMAAAGQVPDLLFLWPGKRTAQVTSKGLIKDLRPWLEGHENEFANGALNPQGPNGEIYELPEQMTATHVMYTNNKLLDELGLTFPKTLDELIAQGETIREAGLIPISIANKGGWQMQSCLLSALTERAGGLDWYDRVIVGDGAAFTDSEFVNALTVIQTLAENDMFMPGVNQADYGAGLTEFVNERAVYHIDGGWRINDMVGELTEEQKPYISLNTFPEIPNQKGQAGSTAMVAGTGYGMNVNLEGDKAEAAWRWIWFYSGPVGSKIRQKNGAMTAYNLPANDDLDILIKALADFIATTPSGYVIDAKMDAEGMAVLHAGLQEMILGAKTPEEVAQDYEAWVAANDSNRQ